MARLIRYLTPYIPAIFVVIWSTGFIGAKYGLPYIEPFGFLTVRYVLVICLFGLGWVVLRGDRIARRDIPGQFVIGVLLHGFYLGGVFFAISRGIPAGMVAIIVGIQPILTAVLSRLWLRDRIGMVQVAGLALGFAGVVMVIVGAGQIDGRETPSAAGLIAAVLALMGVSLGTVLQKRLGGGVPLLSGSIAQFSGALVVTLPLALFLEMGRVEVALPLVLAMAWLVLGLSVLAILLLMVMIRADQVARVTSYFYLVPILTMIQAWFLFDETISTLSALGGLAAVAGVYLVMRKASAQTKTVTALSPRA